MCGWVGFAVGVISCRLGGLLARLGTLHHSENMAVRLVGPV